MVAPPQLTHKIFLQNKYMLKILQKNIKQSCICYNYTLPLYSN